MAALLQYAKVTITTPEGTHFRQIAAPLIKIAPSRNIRNVHEFSALMCERYDGVADPPVDRVNVISSEA